jgi:hypothetical protein
MLPFNRSMRRHRDAIRLVFGIIVFVAGFCSFLGRSVSNLNVPNTFETSSFPNLEFESRPWTPAREQADWRTLKATIIYASSEKTHNTCNFALHAFHNEYFNYETRVLRTPIVRGALNKFLHLQSLIINELQRPVEHQMEWILYFDDAVMLANPHIPLHHFLPPVTDLETFKSLSIIVTKSESDCLNTSVFFIRVSGISLRILTEVMETIYNAPYTKAYENEDNDGGLASATLQNILFQEHHRDKVIFQPREWYNSTASMFYQPYFPTLAHRLLPICETLVVDDEQSQIFPDTADVHRFWHTVSEARRLLDEAKEKGSTSEEGVRWETVKDVKGWLELRAWDTEELERRVTASSAGLKDD